jgi:hypothetical protein
MRGVLSAVLGTFIAGMSGLSWIQPAAVRAEQLGSSNRGRSRYLPARPDAFVTIQGYAKDSGNAALPNALIRLRDARFGHAVETKVADKTGAFSFLQIDPGNYVVELVGATDRAVAATHLISLNAGETASVVVKLPLRSSGLAGLLGQGNRSGESPGGVTELVPAITEQLPQATLQGIPAVVPIGNPVSER